jgi:uncharacterized protein YwqG
MTRRDQLGRRLSEAGLSRVSEQILQMLRPCYRIERKLIAEEEIPIGISRFGGSPDAPPDFLWPEVPGSRKPEPMEFVGQIQLADLSEPIAGALPRQGLLSFFTRWSEGRVFYYPESTVLRRCSSPNPPIPPAPSGFVPRLVAEFRGNANPVHTYRSCGLKFVPDASLPDGNSAIIGQLKLSAADHEWYIEFLEESATIRHQMFGYASPVQNEMEWACDCVRRGEKVKWNSPPERFISAVGDWILLLQVDSDDSREGPGWMWGDLGIVYFWIHRDDLSALAFDRAVVIEQCH